MMKLPATPDRNNYIVFWIDGSTQPIPEAVTAAGQAAASATDACLAAMGEYNAARAAFNSGKEYKPHKYGKRKRRPSGSVRVSHKYLLSGYSRARMMMNWHVSHYEKMRAISNIVLAQHDIAPGLLRVERHQLQSHSHKTPLHSERGYMNA